MTRNVPKFNDNQARGMRKKYEDGATVEGLAKEYDTSASTVCRTIRRVGGTIRTQNYETTKFSDQVALEIRGKYETGLTVHQLADEYDTYPSTISRTVQRAGGTIRPSGFPKGTKLGRRKSKKGILAWLDS